MKKKLVLVVMFLVALVGMVDVTFAYLTDKEQTKGGFVTGDYSANITQTFKSPKNWTPGTTTNANIKVTNDGSVDMTVRAKYIEKWVSADGTVLSGERNGERVALIEIGDNWELSEDGYYYYTETLTQDTSSSDFISTVTFNPNFELEETDMACQTIKTDGKTEVRCESLTTGYAGATYSLEVIVETKQA